MYDNEYNRDIARRLRTIDLNYINSDLSGRGACCCDGEANYKKGSGRLGNPELIGYKKGTYLQGSQMPSGAYGTNEFGMLGRGQVAVVSEPNDTLQRQNTNIVGANSAGLSRRLMQRYNGAGTVLPVVPSIQPYQSAIRHQVYDVRRPPSYLTLTPEAQLQPSFGGGKAGAGFWEDFGTGFKKGFFGTLGLAQPLLPLLGMKGAIASAGIDVARNLAGAGYAGAGNDPFVRPDYGIELKTGAGRSAGSILNKGGRPRLSKAKKAEKKALEKCMMGAGRSAGAKLNTGGRPRLSKAKKAEKKALEQCMNRKSGAGFREDFIKGVKMPYEYAYNKVLKPTYENVLKPAYKEIIEPAIPAIKAEIMKKLREKAQEAIVSRIQGLGRSAGAKLQTGGRPRLSKAKKAEKKALQSCMSGKGKGNRTEIVRGVMNDMGLSMIEASKYVKAHNLY